MQINRINRLNYQKIIIMKKIKVSKNLPSPENKKIEHGNLNSNYNTHWSEEEIKLYIIKILVFRFERNFRKLTAGKMKLKQFVKSMLPYRDEKQTRNRYHKFLKKLKKENKQISPQTKKANLEILRSTLTNFDDITKSRRRVHIL